MSFEIKVSSHTPKVSDDLNEILERFLLDIGYLSGRKTGEELYDSVPFKMWTEFLLKHPEEPMTVDDLSAILEASKPTIYRHLNKLKNMDLLESEEIVEDDGGEVVKKGYKLRNGDFRTAWHVTEANVESVLKRYRQTIDKIIELSEG